LDGLAVNDERHLAIELMARVCAFCEAVLGSSVETTSITRAGDASFGNFECPIWGRFYEFKLDSAGASVQLFEASLDAQSGEQQLLCEVLSRAPNALSTLRTLVCSIETLGEMRSRKDVGGLQTIQRLITGTVPEFQKFCS
jgi:hypothetical protein